MRFQGANGGFASQAAQALGDGTCEVNGYTPTLKGHDGKTTRHAFVMQGKPSDLTKPSMVVIDGAMMFPAR